MEFRKITSDDIKKYRSEVLKSSSASTFDRKMFSLKKFFEWAVKEGYMDDNPIENFLNAEAEVVGKKLGKIEKERKSNSPSYSSTHARIIAKLAGIPKLQKLVYHAFYTRPKWYTSYHNLPIASYFNYAILILLMSSLGFGAYNQFFRTSSNPLAYPTTLTTAGRFLSFQGRLTSNLGNPITTSRDLVFKLYNVDTGGAALWNSNACTISPDTDGIFSTLLGSSCGAQIPSSVFSENSAIWLGVTVGADAEATPRVQIATVAYALNSETLQGYPASAAATANTVPVMNNSGQIVLASTSPKLQSTSGNFAIEGQALTLTTPNTSNGSITINPDGTGTLNLTFEGSAPGGSAQGFVNATNANLTSGSLYYGEVASDATGYNLLELASGATPRTKFAVDSAGNATMSGTINGLAISGGTISSGTWNGSLIGAQWGGTGANNSAAAQFSVPYYSTTGVLGGVLTPGSEGYVLSTNSTNGAPTWIPAGSVGYWQLNGLVLSPSNATAYDLTIGGNATGAAFQVFAATGNITTSGNLDVNGSSSDIAGTLNLSGNTLTSTGDLTINPSGGDVLLGASDNLVLTSAGNLFLDSDTALSDSSLNDAGSYLVGAYDDFTYSTSSNVQAVLKDFDTKLGTLTGNDFWQLTSNSLSPSNSTYALNVGNTASTSAFFHAPGTNNQNAWFNLGTGNVGIGTTTPQTALSLGSTVTPTGIALYNTADEATNYERLRFFWNNNDAVIKTEKSGSGLARNLYVESGRDLILKSASAQNTYLDSGGTFVFRDVDNSDATVAQITSTNGYARFGDSTAPSSYSIEAANGLLVDNGNAVFDGNVSIAGYATTSASLAVGNTTALAGVGNINASGRITGTTIYQGANQVCDASGNCSSIGNYWQLNNKVLAPANTTYDLTIGGSATGSAFQVFAATGNITTAGNLDVNGTTNDIAGTLNLSGNTLTSTGDLSINPAGGDVLLGASDNLVLTSAGNLLLDSDTALSDSSLNDAGSYLVGAYDDFTYSTSTNVQGVLKEFDTKLGTLTSNDFWRLSNSVLSPTQIAYDLAIGGTGTGSAFQVFAATGNITTSGNLDVNGATSDIAGTLNLSGNTLTSTADLTINPAGGDVLIGSTDNLVLTSAGNLFLDADTSITDTGLNDAGAYGVGTYDEFTYSASTNVQDVLHDIDIKLGTLTTNDFWQLSTNSLSPSNSTYAFNIGNTASTSAYFHVPGTNDQNAWFSLGTGNLGIGTINPATYDLEVAGTGGFTTSVNSPIFQGQAAAVTFGSASHQTNISGSSVVVNSLAGMIKGTAGTLSGVTGTPNYVTYWSDANTIAAEQYLATSRGGLGGNVTAIGAGELLYSTGTTTYDSLTAGTTGMALISGGTGAPTWGTLGTTYGGTGANNSGAAQYSVPYYSAAGTLGGILSPGAEGYVLTTHSTDQAPTWTQLPAAGTNYWQLNNKILAPGNTTYDLTVGGSATGSAFQVFGMPTVAGNIAKITSNVITTGNLLSVTGTSLTTGSALFLANNTANNANLIVAQAGASLTNRLTLDSNGQLRIYDTNGTNYLNLTHNGTNAQITANTGNIEIGSGSGDLLVGDASNAVDIHFGYTASPVNIEGEAGSVINFTQAGNITSATNNTYDLGAVGNVWNDVYATVLHQGSYLVCDSSGANCPAGAQYWRLNGLVLSPIQASYDLTIGGNATGSAFQVFAATGNITTAGNLDVNGTTNDIAGTLNLSGNTLTSSGNLNIQSVSGWNYMNTPSVNNYLFVYDNTAANRYSYLSGSSIALTDDGTTKLYFPYTGSSYINNGGNFGIGTTTPTAKLDVVGDASTSASLVFRGTSPATIDVLNGSRLDFQTSPGGDTGLASKMTLLSNGNVGIGTTNPGAPLEVYNTTPSQDIIRLTNSIGTYTLNNYTFTAPSSYLINTGGYLSLSAGTSYIVFKTSGTDKMMLSNSGGLSLGNAYTSTDPGAGNMIVSGNVGVGTTNPSAKLDVAGNVNISGYATASGSLALGNTTAAAGPGNLNMSGALTVAGPIKPGGNAGTSGYFLTSAGGGVNTWTDPSTITGVNYWQLNGLVLSPANAAAYDLTVGGTATGSAFQVFAATGNVSTAGDLAVNGGDINSSGDLTINPTGGDILIGSGDNLVLTSAADLFLDADTALSDTGLNDAGAYGVGTYDEFTYSASTNVQDVLHDIDTKLGTLTSNDFWQLNNKILSPANSTYDLTIGGTATGSAFQVFAATGNVTTAGNLDVNGTTNDIAGTLNLSGNTLTSTGDLTINPTGGDVLMGASDNFVLTAAANLFLDADTALSDSSLNDAGSYLVGAYDDFTNSSSTNVQAVLKDLDTAITGAGVNHWQLNSNLLAPINVNNDLAIGGTATASSKFQIMGATGNIYTANNTIDWTLNNAVDALNIDSNTLSIDASNNRVGIGTASPISVAHIYRSSAAMEYLTVQNDAANPLSGAGIQILRDADIPVGKLWVSRDGASPLDFYIENPTLDDSGDIIFKTRSFDRMTIKGTGWVGIGTTDPTALLDIAGNASASGSLTFRTGAATVQATTMSNLTLGSSSTGNVIVNSRGSTALTANGTGLTAGGNLYLTSAGNLFLDSDTALSDTGLNDAGAYGVGTYDEFTHSSSTNVQDVLHDLDSAIGGAGTNYWNLGTGTIYPGNTTLDLLLGSSATASAKFAFTGVAGGTPTASISGSVAGNATSIDGNGNITTQKAQTLTLGGTATGNVVINSRGSAALTANGANLTTVGTFTLPNSNTMTGVTNYLRLSQGLSVGGADTYYFNSAGSINANAGTFAGNLDVNGTTNDIAGTLNLSGNTLTSTGDLTINPTGGDVLMGASDNFVLTAASNLFLDADTALSDISLNDAGAYLVGVYDDFSYSSSTSVQGVLKDLDTAIGGAGTNHWQLSSNVLAPVNVGNDLSIGGNATASSKFQIMGATGNIYTANNTVDWTLNNAVDALNIDSNTLSIDASGNRVGIGNNAPNYPLDVTGSAAFGTSGYKITLNGATSGGEIYNTNTTLTLGGGSSPISNSGIAQIVLGNNDGIQILGSSTGAQDIVIDPRAGGGNILLKTGNVGINTISPLSKLSVVGTATSAIGKAAFLVDQYENQDILTASASGVTKMTLANDGTLKLYNASSTISNTSGDITLNAASNLISFSGDNLGNIGNITAAGVLNAGGLSGVAYNTFAGGGDAPTSTAITTSNDLFVGGDTELKGGLYLTGKNIFNVVGGVSTGTITFANDPTLVNNYNALSYGGWLVNNSTNNGIAALMVNQNKGGDIFSASSSGTTKFVISNSGNVQVNSTDPLLTFNETDNVAWQWKVTGDQWLVQRSAVDQIALTPTSFLFKQSYLQNNEDALVRMGTSASGSELRLTAGTGSDYLTILSDGKVGIGTISPSTSLTLYGTNADLLLQSAGNDIGDIIFRESDGNQKGRIWTATTAGASGELLYLSTGDNAGDIMIDNNGYVGIGGATPTGMNLEVLSSVGGSGIRALNSVALGTGSGGALWSGTTLTPSAADQRIGGVFFSGSNSVSYAAGAGITGWSGSAWNTGNIESYLRFETTPNAGTSRSERMRITAAGNVGIGITNPSYLLHVNGTSNFVSSVYYNGTAYASMNNQINGRTRMVDTGCAGSWGSSCDTGNNGYVDYADALLSDERLKTVVRPLTDVMDKLMQIDSVYYEWNDEYKTLGLPINAPQEIGMIAQNVQTFFPELVYKAGPNDPYFHLDYQKFTAVLLQGIKEQQFQITNINSSTASNSAAIANLSALLGMVTDTIKVGAVETQNLVTTSFTAFQGTVDNMLVKSGLVAGRIETKLISPIPGEDLAVELAADSKFKVQDSNQNVVASIDNTGNARLQGDLSARQATFSGTLYAEEIKSKSLDEIKDILTQVQTDQALLTQASAWDISATNSASLDNIVVADLYVTNQAAINSLSVTNSLAIGTDMILQSVVGSDQLAMNSIDSLTTPLRIQSLGMAPIEMMAGLIKIDTLGNVIISGNLAVGGGIESGSLNLVDRTLQGSPLQGGQESSPSALFTLRNTQGNTVSTINASGSALFKDLTTQGLTIAGAVDATNSAVVDGVITTNATAGSGVVPAYTSEITIRNANVTDYTLVYVTPTSSTDNYVLYVKSKSPGEFVVGFTNPISIDVNFNWWIVRVSQ